MNRRLLKMIAAVPAGEKLPIARFARELGASQAVIAGLVDGLVREGKLDRETLRASAHVGKPRHARGAALFNLVADEAKQRGLPIQKASLEAFGNPARIYALRDHAPTAKTIAKAEAWLGREIGIGEPQEGTPSAGLSTAAVSADAPPAPSADALLAEIDRYCARTGTPPGYVGKVAFNHPGFVPLLRKRGTLRAQSAAEVRAIIARFPGGIAKADAVAPMHRRAQSGRIEQIEPAPFEPTPGGSLERVTGQDLYDAIVRGARQAGQYISHFARPLSRDPNTYLQQLKRAKTPKPYTVERVRALVEGREVPPQRPKPEGVVTCRRSDREALGLPPSRRGINEERSLSAAVERRDRVDDAKLEAEVAHSSRLPGESLADAVARHAAEREADFRNATRLTTAHPLPLKRSTSQLLTRDEHEDSHLGEVSAERRERELDDLSAPSSVLRRAQRDWPDQCAKVKAIAAEMGVSLAEAWRQVIEAGVLCKSEDLREESLGTS